VTVGNLQPSEPGLEVGALEGVAGPAKADSSVERLPGLPTAPGSPEHVGELGSQVHRGSGHHFTARAVAVHDGQRGAEGGDGLVVGEGPDGVVACHLEVSHGALGLPGGGEMAPEEGSDLLEATG
jgi:hypothetical protein